jgi:hypothetical protein
MKSKKKTKKLAVLMVFILAISLTVLAFIFARKLIYKDNFGKNQTTQQKGTNEAGVADNNKNNETVNKNESNTSELTITTPKANQATSNSQTLEGTAPADTQKVYYRLQSNDIGLLGQGELMVSSSRFSGKIATGGYTGRGFVEVYLVDKDGLEKNNIKTEVIFK